MLALAAQQRGPGVYYPEALRDRIMRWARRQLGAGATAAAVAAALGIGRTLCAAG